MASKKSNSDQQLLRVAMVWNGTIVREVTRTKPGDITVGEGPRCDFVVPAGGASSYTLFHYERDKQEPIYLLHLRDDMSGKVTVRETQMSVREFLKSPAVHPAGGSYRAEVEPGDWGLVTIGDVQFFWQFVPSADKVSAVWAFDRNLALFIFVVALIATAVIVTGYALWDELARKPPPISLRQAKFMVEKHKEPPKEEEQKEGPKEKVGKRHMGKEGKAGEQDKPKHIKTKIPKATQQTIQKVTKIGALGAISSSKIGGALKEIFNSDTQGFGDKLGAAMDGTGDEFAMGHGTGGWSTKGTGTGAGGTGWGRVYGTSDIDTGGGRGRGRGVRIRKKKEKKVTYKVTTAPPDVEGFCAKEAVNRVVRAHQGGIRFCFEKELQRDPKLSGKVVAGWKINLDGRVQFPKIAKSTLNSERVEGCMLRNIRRWIFPKPQGGTCVISYPFVFKGGI